MPRSAPPGRRARSPPGRREPLYRGTALTFRRGARSTSHLAYRPARAEWGRRMAWAGRSHELEWYRFRAPGDTTAAGALRLPAARSPVSDRSHPRRHGPAVPGLTMTRWQQALRGEA